MLKDVKWAEDGTYRPHEINSPARFFTDGLKNSTQFDLQLGYFNSAAISALAEGFASFISNGGVFRLVINQIVSRRDKEAIIQGERGDVIDCVDLSNFEELRKTFDAYQDQFFHCLAYLISVHRIQIVIIKPLSAQGIAHTKSGQFRDGQMRRISKDITKYYQMACSSMSYTPFAFYGLMFSMCLFCLFLRLFCYMCVARQKRRQSPTKTYLFLLIRT